MEGRTLCRYAKADKGNDIKKWKQYTEVFGRGKDDYDDFLITRQISVTASILKPQHLRKQYFTT